MSNIKRSSGENAVKSAAYISGTKLTLKLINPFTGIEKKQVWDFRSKAGVAYSTILAPDGSPSWVFDREELWNRAESFEIDEIARTGRRLMVALPRELTLEQNIDLARQFTLEYLVNHGMVVDLNIHYDNEYNPHMHLQITTRKLVADSEGNINFAPSKTRNWGKEYFLNYWREGVATVINHHLELHGHLGRVSHLSHKARGIELTPGIHEGAARHMSASERRELNEAILAKNASAIRDCPELVFQKLSINKPVFTKEDIATALSDALYLDMVLEEEEANVAAERRVGEGNIGDDTGSLSSESLQTQYANEFILAYERLLQSPEIKLINSGDLRGRTLYALTKRMELEARFIDTVETLGESNNHSLGIKETDIEKRSIVEWVSDKAKEVSKVLGNTAVKTVAQGVGLPVDSFSQYLPDSSAPHLFTPEQKAAIVAIVNGGDISILEGYPGSGKTTTMREIVRQLRRAGYRVIGTATSSSAAEVLGIEAGIESKNISRLRKEWQLAKNDRFRLEHEAELKFELPLRADYYKEEQYSLFGTSLSNRDVLIIDEASMVELAGMDYLLTEVKAAGAKAILVGDNNQLAAIGAGGAFKKATQIIGSNKLTEVVRHRATDSFDEGSLDIALHYRQATRLLGQYKINDALEIYNRLGAFNIHQTEAEAKAALVKDYTTWYIELAKHLSKDNLSATKSLVIGAYTNTAVNYFNSTIRQHLKAAGILRGRSYNFRSGNETIELAKGEQIVFLENKPKFLGLYGILNGEVGTVLDFTQLPDEFGRGVFTVLVHKADGSKRVVTINTEDSNNKNIFPAKFKHGYAVTGHKLQGDTVTHMMVYFESMIGYESFNVLMTRHRETVRLYAAKDMLEDVVYSKLGNNSKSYRNSIAHSNTTDRDESYLLSLRAKYDIISYKKAEKDKEGVEPWRIGLSMIVAKRTDSSFAGDYAEREVLSPNEKVICKYLESREAVFALRNNLREWQSRESRALKVQKLHMQLHNNSEYYRTECAKAAKALASETEMNSSVGTVEAKKAKEDLNVPITKDHIKPYAIFHAGKSLEEDIKADKAQLSKLLRETQNIDLLIWANLPSNSREELEVTIEALHKETEKRQKLASIICDNYHGFVEENSKKKKAKNAAKFNNDKVPRSKDFLTMGDRLRQLSMNYEPIERHAEYSLYRYHFISRESDHALLHLSAFGSLVNHLNTIANYRSSPAEWHLSSLAESSKAKTKRINYHYEQIVKGFKKDHALITEYIEDIKLKLLQAEEKIAKLNAIEKEIEAEIVKYKTYAHKLFPEYLSRIYKDEPNKVLAAWDKLKEEYGGDKDDKTVISNRSYLVLKNPKLLGSLRGIGVGNIFGLTDKRQKAITILEVLPKALKEYEGAISKLDELNYYKASSEYKDWQKLQQTLLEDINLLKSSLPGNHEEKLLNELTEIFSNDSNKSGIGHNSNNSSSNSDRYLQKIYEALQVFAKKEEAQNIIYEYYNYLGKQHDAADFTEERYEDKLSHIVRSQKSKLAAQAINHKKQNLLGATLGSKRQNLRQNLGRSNGQNPEHYRPSYAEVNSRLTQSHYEQIFHQHAHMINEDAPKITKSGDWINCGSLGMNLKSGTWNRFSSNDKGNIYSFISFATGCSNKEALQILASKVGLEQNYDYKHSTERDNKGTNVTNSKYRSQIKLAQATTVTQISNKTTKDEWIPYSIVPSNARPMNPKTDFAWMLKEHDATHIHEYRNIKGELIGGAMRLVNKTTKAKQVYPYAYCKNDTTNQNPWRFKGFTDHGYKPIYGSEKLCHDRRTILIVEGEKTADVAQKLLPEYAVMSWLGGSSSVDKVNWSQLKGRSVVIWPDNDVPGFAAANKILNHINIANDKIGYAAIVDLNINSLGRDQSHSLFPDKWDLADELPDGILLSHIKWEIEKAKYQSQNRDLLYNPEQLENKILASESNTPQASTLELLGQYKHLEARSIISYSHEFLKPEHGLYRDTLACLIPQIRQQTQQSKKGMETQWINAQKAGIDPAGSDNTNSNQIKTAVSPRNFIIALESKYSELISKYKSSGISYLEHYNSIHHNYEKSLTAKGHDRAELYKTIIRDVTLLHSLELSKFTHNNIVCASLPKLTKTHHEIIAKTVYDAINEYKRPFSKRMQSNNLTPQEKTAVAESIHARITNSAFRKTLLSSQTIEPPITQGRLQYELGLTFSKIVHVGSPKQLQQMQLQNHSQNQYNQAKEQVTHQAKQIAIPAEDAEAVRHKAYKEATEAWLINDKRQLSQTHYELCIHRAIFELKAADILKNSSSFDAVQIANQSIPDNPYAETIAAIISHEEIYIDNKGKDSGTNKIIKSQNRLLNIIDKRDLTMKANQIFKTRTQRIKATLNDNNSLIQKATNKTKEIINRILAEHITDHEMTYGKGNITTERLTSMHEIARHEANLEVAMRQEWDKQEINTQEAHKTQKIYETHNTQQPHETQKPHKAPSIKATNATKSPVKQTVSDVNTSIAVARQRMRREMYEAVHQHGHDHADSHFYSLDHDRNLHSHDQNPQIDNHHNHMEAHQALPVFLSQIAIKHNAHIHAQIAQVQCAQIELEKSNCEQKQEHRRHIYHEKKRDMGI